MVQKLNKTEKDKIRSIINKIEDNGRDAWKRYNKNLLTRKQYDRLEKDGKARIKELKRLLKDNIPY